MISDELFDELFPVGYRLMSYTDKPPITRGQWKCIGMLCLTVYVFERIE